MFRRTLAALYLAAVAAPAAAATISSFATQAIEVALVRLATQFRALTSTGWEPMPAASAK